MFGADWDVVSDVTKSRLYGFHDVVDSEAMFVRLLRRFREERIVPQNRSSGWNTWLVFSIAPSAPAEKTPIVVK